MYESKPETNTISSSPTAEIFKRSDKQLPKMDIRNNPTSTDENFLVRQLDELRHQSS